MASHWIGVREDGYCESCDWEPKNKRRLSVAQEAVHHANQTGHRIHVTRVQDCLVVVRKGKA